MTEDNVEVSAKYNYYPYLYYPWYKIPLLHDGIIIFHIEILFIPEDSI